jgi:HSP20 family protein
MALARRTPASSLTRWEPGRELQRLREEMDRLFEGVFGRGEGEGGGWLAGAWAPPIDLYETDDAFILKAELPATEDVENVQATFKEGLLELRLPKHEAAKPKRIDITG